MSTDQTGIRSRIDGRSLKPVIKLLLVFAGLLVLWGMVTSLPGIERVIPDTPVTFGATVGAVFALAIVAVLAFAAMKVDTLFVETLEGPNELVSDAATIAKHFLLFVAVLVAHSGLAPLFAAFMAGPQLMWLYDLAFLVLAVIPVAIIAVTMYRNIDAASERITSRVSGGGDDGRATDGSRRTTGGSDRTMNDSGRSATDPGTSDAGTTDRTGSTTDDTGSTTDDSTTK